MAKFLTGNELNLELEKLFERADEQIILISPFIKLHDRYISSLRTKKNNSDLEIIIVFGKNEEDLSKSMKEEDFNFFKDFPNIEIRYEKRLHAKYYANESSAIMTSMNLYSFSQDNNIEAGVMTKATLLVNIANQLMTNVTGEDSYDTQAWTYFKRVIEQSDLLFRKTPEYESTMLGLSKKYIGSKIDVDKLSDFFANRSKYDNKKVEPTKQNFISTPNNPTKHENISNGKSQETTEKYFSTTALSKETGIGSKDLISKFEIANWIVKDGKDWKLTEEGKNKGAIIKKGHYGDYIAWPNTLIKELK